MPIIATAFALGILATEYMPFHMCVLIGVAAFIVIPLVTKDLPRSTVAIVVAVFVLGAGRHCLYCEVAGNDISRISGTVCAFEGYVSSDSEPGEGRVRYIIRAKRALYSGRWHAISGSVMVTEYADDSEGTSNPNYGDHLRLQVSPYEPRDPSNPGSFSWRQYLARQAIYSCASVRSSSQVTPLRRREGNLIVAAALGVKHCVANSVTKITGGTEGSVIIGMVLGTYAYLPSETLRNFTRTGTLHLLAASGYNCWILIFISAPLLRILGLAPKWRCLTMILLIIIYLLMAGAKPSFMRAAIMSSLLLLAGPLRRVPDTTSLFFTSGLAILLINPADLFDVGFQLSYLAVWALLTVSPVVRNILWVSGTAKRRQYAAGAPRLLVRCISNVIKGMAATTVATIAVSLVTAPIVAYYFNNFSLVAIPANVVVELAVPFIFAIGFISPVASLWSGSAIVVGWIGGAITKAMLWAVNILGSPSYSSLPVSSPGILAIAGYYVILYTLLIYVRSRLAER